MKKYIAGLLTGVLLFALAFSALAITGRMTIEVDPINIQVNGETFVPKDVNGAEVPVFAYNGTTYAPLRALAEAYGLEVGYDASTNMATVADPDASVTASKDTKATLEDAAYREFKKALGAPEAEHESWRFSVDETAFRAYASNIAKDTAYQYLKRLATECFAETTDWTLQEQYRYVGITICNNQNKILVGITGYSDRAVLKVDCVWDDFELRIGQPTMNLEL